MATKEDADKSLPVSREQGMETSPKQAGASGELEGPKHVAPDESVPAPSAGAQQPSGEQQPKPEMPAESTSAPPGEQRQEQTTTEECTSPSQPVPSTSAPSDREEQKAISNTDPPRQPTRELPPLEYDWQTGLPLMHFNYVLETMAPRHNIVAFNTLNNLQLQGKLRQAYGSFTDVEAVLAGNAALQLHIPSVITAPAPDGDGQTQVSQIAYSDYEVYVTKLDGTVCTAEELNAHTLPVMAVIEKDMNHPGYVKLRVVDKDKVPPSMLTTTNDISSMAMLENFDQGQHATEAGVDIDASKVAMAFKCSSWPAEAKGWISRERPTGWPPKDVIMRAAATDCYIVGQSHPASTFKDIQWHYRLLGAERIVAESLNDVQRQCYIFLKLLQLEHLDLPAIITSRHLTSVLFWMCERLPQEEWNPGNLAAYFVGLIDQLLHSLIDEEVPDYFMPQCNLLESVSEDFLYRLMAKVSDLRREPLKYLFNFNRKYRFLFSPLFESWQHIFSPIVKDVEEAHNSIQRCLVAQVQSSGLLLNAFVQQKYFEKAQEVADSRVALFANLGHDISAADQLSECALHLPVDQSIRVHEHITAHYPTAYSAMSNLGCMYHAKIFETEDEAEKMKLQAAADAVFRESISKGGRAAGLMDYGHFLFNVQRYGDAVETLTKLIEAEKINPKSCNSYGQSELATMDEHLTKEINNMRDKNVVVMAVCYACYLLVKCHMKLDQQQAALNVTQQLHDVCTRLGPDRQPLSLSLLGYSLFSMGDYGGAESAFNQVVGLQEGNALAAENVQLCQAMKMSMGL